MLTPLETELLAALKAFWNEGADDCQCAACKPNADLIARAEAKAAEPAKPEGGLLKGPEGVC